MLTPLIPVKTLAHAKGRLAPELQPIQRRLLTIAMLEDVLDAVAATAGLARPVVVSPDREVWRRAAALGCRVVEEPAAGDGDGGDVNAALRLAADAVAGDAPAGGLLVVAADLPLADADSLGRVRDALADAPVVVVPSRDGRGTNVLGWADPGGFSPAFGPDSAMRHLSVDGAVALQAPRLALDVDTVADLRAAAAQADAGSVTGRRLADLRLLERLGSAAR
jgi:2-phospho-L-lactate/phosphoenolpyruvate guanylyltransferase